MSRCHVGMKWVKKMQESQYFVKISEFMWTEYQNGKKFADFTEISFEYPEVVLQKDKNAFVKLTESFGYWGNDQNSISVYFTKGKWENAPEPTIQEEQITKKEYPIELGGASNAINEGPNDGIKWVKSKPEPQYFEKISENIWIEYHNGKIISEFTEFSFLYPEAILKKSDGAFIKLTESSAFYGQSLNSITNCISNGKWQSCLQAQQAEQSNNENTKEANELYSIVLRLVNDLKFTNALESIQEVSLNRDHSNLKKAKSILEKLNKSQIEYQQLIVNGNKLLFRNETNQARKTFKQALVTYNAVSQDVEILGFFNSADLNLIDYMRKGKKKYDKREDIAKREDNRNISRALKNFKNI